MAVEFLQDIRITSKLLDKDGDAGTSGQVLSSTATGTDWITPTTIVDNYVRTAYIVLNSGVTGVTRTAGSPSTGYTKFTLTPSTWFGSYNNTRGFIVQVVDTSTGQIVGAEIDLNTGTTHRIDVIFKGSVADGDFDANVVYTGTFGGE